MLVKPSLTEATQQLIQAVKEELPLYAEDTFVCGPENSCIGCPKKLMELVETEVSYWESSLNRGIAPNFEELRRFGKLCQSVKRGLIRNGVINKK
ncbi:MULTISPECIES: hypothetical protein [Vibrio]|jgi:hypothetical protein|uniref:Oxidoreductase n=1 Tax=Vibrio mediterranei TaxID=689 RepID=A0ABX5D965_9VIBR|nr:MULTISPECIES: hypothetical protein [Vibrio]KFA98815.1 hypothetical protein HW45_07295 [Vibrio sp. ER1A]MCG9623635.1 hypothetical protein [Vibrio mediterranei]MCG9657693.1 hypothetical protein [Vibrio mediterranei]MCG9661948.1 hypothetical protein [Vibrio mediterranei]PCD86353.1 hypothetical protein COR52_22095 [Vibrio mediterranei]